MSTTLDHWYARLGFGIELGPMPREDLDDLAQSGQLLGTDSVRDGDSGTWVPANELSGLFAELAADCASEPETKTDTVSGHAFPAITVTQLTDVAAEAPEPAESHESDEEPDPVAAPDDSIPVAQSLDEFEFSAGTSDDTLDDTAIGDTSEGDFVLNIPAADTQPVAETVDDADFELNLPEPSTPDPPVSSQSMPDSDAAEPEDEPDFVLSFSDRAESTEPDYPSIPIRRHEPQTDAGLNDDEDPDIEPVAVVVPPPAVRIPPAKDSARYSNSSLPSDGGSPLRFSFRAPGPAGIVKLIVGIACAGVLIHWTLPGPEPDIYAEYTAIYAELQERRAAPANSTGWAEFVEQSKAQIDAANPWLEKSAQPGDRDKNLLLYVGRDLRDMLDETPASEADHQQRLDGFFKQLEEIYASR